MSRPLRIIYDGAWYHVMNRGRRSEEIFSGVGDDSFVDKIREKFFKEKQHVEVPESKVLSPDINRIKQAVCRKYKTSPEDLLLSRRGAANEARNVAIYLIRQYTGEKLTTIGKEFNISKYSTVSSVVSKVGNELQKDNQRSAFSRSFSVSLVKSAVMKSRVIGSPRSICA